MQNEQVSMERLREIYDQCGGDAALVAQELGLSTEELASRVTTAPALPARRRRPPADLGVPYYRDRIVSVRHAENPYWPKEDEAAIDDARAKYEAGTHEMCQGRDRDWFVLYLIPRKRRCAPRKFFVTHE